jgi:hypothetical protein
MRLLREKLAMQAGALKAGERIKKIESIPLIKRGSINAGSCCDLAKAVGKPAFPTSARGGN